MVQTLTCPACGFRDLDLNDYESMIVLRADLALFSLRCNRCASKISSVQPIPATLREGGSLRRDRDRRGHGPGVRSLFC